MDKEELNATIDPYLKREGQWKETKANVVDIWQGYAEKTRMEKKPNSAKSQSHKTSKINESINKTLEE